MSVYLSETQTMESTVQKSANPLINFMRQPKIYLRLPSNGNYWAPGSLQVTENGEYPVYSMTAKDEMLLKVPDALMNGQAVVDVIQNCIPNIKNAWAIPSLDMDAILIAIRIATYGELMKTPITFGEDIEMEYQVDLRNVLDSLYSNISWDEAVPINENITVFVKPIDYKAMTKSAIQTFETQKIIQVANDETMDEDSKVKVFKESFSRLTEVTVDMITNSIYQVDTSAGSTNNPKFIKDFINNADKEIFNKIQNHLEVLKDRNTLKPIQVSVTEEMRAQGITGEIVEVPLVFDAANFFV